MRIKALGLSLCEMHIFWYCLELCIDINKNISAVRREDLIIL